MSRSFRRALRSGQFHGTPQEVITNSVPEFSAQDGVADFVLTPSDIAGRKLEWMLRLAHSITTPATANIVASLKTPECKSVERVARETGLSERTVSSILVRIAADNEIVCGNTQKGFRLCRAIRDRDVELWAYELKLKHWKRALYQTLQYKAFAHCVTVVLPEETKRVALSKVQLLKRYGVGLVILDTRTDSVDLLVRPRRSRPRSLGHYLYALSVFARRGIPNHPAYLGPAKPPRLPKRRV